jgi:AraC family transcriptional regulator
VGTAFATVTEEEGIVATSADVNGFTVAELRFPPGYVQETFAPELPYLAFVLEGAVEKEFVRRAMYLGPACAVTMPVGAAHSARFGAKGARIVIVRARHGSSAVAGCLDRLADLRGPGLDWIARRLAAELRAPDAAAPLATEGFALELLAATSRAAAPARRHRRPPAWLSSADELLRERHGDCVRLSELADAVGVRPAHLARVFRAHYGVSVGDYGRRLRLAWAAAEIARGETTLAAIATEAGFADQSHFTRLFKRYVGITPARYRAETRS